jgi:Leucine-rich repeat (LRR) protein
LKSINLSECESITKLPDLCAPNLETLDLSYCRNLIEVHESNGFLGKLKEWNLEYCEKLQILPSRLMLKSLKYFDLSFCSRLEKFPYIHPEMKCLEDLYLSKSGIRELPSSLGYLTGLSTLQLNVCQNLGDFPVNINKLQLLEEIDIPIAKLSLRCNSFDSLTSLDLTCCGGNIIRFFDEAQLLP